jgi:hypothetical protein
VQIELPRIDRTSDVRCVGILSVSQETAMMNLYVKRICIDVWDKCELARYTYSISLVTT